MYHAMINPTVYMDVDGRYKGLDPTAVLAIGDGDNDVELFERDVRPGGHAHTVPTPDAGRTLALDTGFLVHNTVNYPNLLRLFGELGRTGELRTVAHADRRLAEAQRFGLAPVLQPEAHRTLRAALAAALGGATKQSGDSALAPAKEVVRAA